jgi:Transcription factor WhiB
MPVDIKDFRDQGACGPRYAETGKDYWFGPDEDSPDAYGAIISPKLRETARRRDRERAKAICRICPVRMPCLQWAVENGEKNGIWGGMTSEERTRMVNGTPRFMPQDKAKEAIAS